MTYIGALRNLERGNIQFDTYRDAWYGVNREYTPEFFLDALRRGIHVLSEQVGQWMDEQPGMADFSFRLDEIGRIADSGRAPTFREIRACFSSGKKPGTYKQNPRVIEEVRI